MATNKNKNTRKARSLVKTKKSAAKPVEASIAYKPVQNVLKLAKQSFLILKAYWKHFTGVIIVYVVLNAVFVSGFGSNVNISETSSQLGNRIIGGLVGYTQLLGASTTAASQAAGVYQVFLNLLFSLAIIWSLRQAFAGRTMRIRDAFYQSMHPLVPFMLVILVIGLQLLPMIIGTGVYQLVVSTGIASSPIETVLWLTVALVTVAVSFYFVAVSLLALIIVTLPDMQPVQALKLARKLARGRRFLILRKLLFLPVVLLLLATIILLPLAILVPVVAPWVLLVVSPGLITVAYSYLYVLYRELVGE